MASISKDYRGYIDKIERDLRFLANKTKNFFNIKEQNKLNDIADRLHQLNHKIKITFPRKKK